MPIEVRQVSIKTNITSGNKNKEQQRPAKLYNLGARLSNKERESIIQDCVNTIFEILEERNNR